MLNKEKHNVNDVKDVEDDLDPDFSDDDDKSLSDDKHGSMELRYLQIIDSFSDKKDQLAERDVLITLQREWKRAMNTPGGVRGSMKRKTLALVGSKNVAVAQIMGLLGSIEKNIDSPGRIILEFALPGNFVDEILDFLSPEIRNALDSSMKETASLLANKEIDSNSSAWAWVKRQMQGDPAIWTLLQKHFQM